MPATKIVKFLTNPFSICCWCLCFDTFWNIIKAIFHNIQRIMCMRHAHFPSLKVFEMIFLFSRGAFFFLCSVSIFMHLPSQDAFILHSECVLHRFSFLIFHFGSMFKFFFPTQMAKGPMKDVKWEWSVRRITERPRKRSTATKLFV